jgi:hypothetical protein
MRISVQACIEAEDSSPAKVITIGCVARDAGVDPASGMGLFVSEAHELLRQMQAIVLREQADEFVRVAAGCLACGHRLGVATCARPI